MIRKLLTTVAIAVLSISYAEENKDEEVSQNASEAIGENLNAKTTALYLISPKNDANRGRAGVFDSEYGEFSIEHDGHNAISVAFQFSQSERLRIEFYSSKGTVLKPGIYKDAVYPHYYPTHSPDLPSMLMLLWGNIPYQVYYDYDDWNNYPRFGFSDQVAGFSYSMADFEIKELTYDQNGKIESFAANFSYQSSTPMLGSIRYHSMIPIEPLFEESFEKFPKSTVSIGKWDREESGFRQILNCDDDDDNDIDIADLRYGGNGARVEIYDSHNKRWLFNFAAPLEEALETGHYNACRYPFNNSDKGGIEIVTPDGDFCSEGEFRVYDIVKGADGGILSMAVNFRAINKHGEILVGAIRISSRLKVNFGDFIRR